MPKDFEEEGVLDHIGRLSSADEIFRYLLLPFEQEVLNVSRLHIMKRFGSYLKEVDLSGKDEEAIFLECRLVLKRAYNDFTTSTPIDEKVFKVHQEEDEKRKARFVGLDALKLATE